MPSSRTTLYLEKKIHRALKIKAAETDRSISDIVNEALVLALREDQADLDAFRKREKEPSKPFEKVLSELKRDGLL